MKLIGSIFLVMLLSGCDNPFGYPACHEGKSFHCYKSSDTCYPTGGSCTKWSEMK